MQCGQLAFVCICIYIYVCTHTSFTLVLLSKLERYTARLDEPVVICPHTWLKKTIPNYHSAVHDVFSPCTQLRNDTLEYWYVVTPHCSKCCKVAYLAYQWMDRQALLFDFKASVPKRCPKRALKMLSVKSTSNHFMLVYMTTLTT